MNYLRNAFGAVTQYYQELPPINASTLTGAIDVIVVERPGEDGDLELACSPFHVRFGKWQILRPGEKGVTVMVNGNVIPYQMKIGDAGEAFFVFETDEDVPEELVTSPLLKPTKVGATSEVQEIHSKAGRFGAQESSDDEQGKISDVSDLEPLPQDNSSLSQEPSYLDLSEQKSHESSSETTASTEETVPSPPTSISTLNSVADELAPPEQYNGSASVVGRTADTVKKASYSVLSVAPGVAPLAKTVAAAVPGLATEKAHLVGEKLRHTRHRSEVVSSTTRDDKGDGRSPNKENNGNPPDVLYKDHVVLDMSGYHRAEKPQGDTLAEEEAGSTDLSFERTPSDSTIDGHQLFDQHTRQSSDVNVPPHVQTDRLTNPDTIAQYRDSKGKRDHSASRSSPRRPSLDQLSHFHSDTQLKSSLESSAIPSLALPPPSNQLKRHPSFNRGSSAPPELDISGPQSTPEYSWEWGAFPIASPARRTFPLPDDNSLPRASNLRNSISKEGNLDLEAFGSDGVLSADPKNSSVFWIKIDGKKHAFELSLCGNLLLDDDVEEDLRTFASHKIDRARLLAEPQVIENYNIVMKWDIKLITRRDSPRMIPALKRWAETMRNPSPPGRPESPLSDPGEFSRSSSPSSLPAPSQGRPSTWSRWFRRNNRPQSVSVTGSPALDATISETKPALPQPSLTPPPPSTPSIVEPAQEPPTRKFAKTLRLTSDQLKALDLKKGANTITFSLSTTGVVACTAKIFVWSYTDHIVVSDIDGTITKSDALGHVFTMIGRDWTHIGVAKLYTDIARNGYKLMYLTSRAIGQADSTRDYLKGIKQNNYQLPEGPVIMSPDRLMASLHREVIMRKPEVFKMACLRDIQRLFGEAARVPFYAGFGNRITDALSYRSVNVPSARIFTIDSAGEVKMELLELAGYKSSYIHMTDLVDQMFPPVHRKWAAEFTDFNYWKDPIPEFDLPDLSPPSPALSAVSETSGNSRLARLRNFSLGRQASLASVQAATDAVKAVNAFSRRGAIGYKPPHRHRSTSPLARGDSEVVSDEESSGAEYHTHARRRLSNGSSMPGSLPSSGNGSYSDYEEEEEEEVPNDEQEEDDLDGSADGHSLDDVEAEDPLFDDLAAGQMERVPF